MLLENNQYNLAHNVVGLNFLNFEGQKFSKSKKIGVFCNALLDEEANIDVDALRAYLTTIIPENRDTDFKWEDYKNNCNSELVGKYGNLFNRSLNMIKNYFNNELDIDLNSPTVELNDLDKETLNAIKEMPAKIAESFEKAELREAYKLIMSYASVGNGYLEKSAPWSLMKQEKPEEAKKVLYICLNLCASLCIVASPIIPTKVKELWTNQIGLAGDPTANDMWQKASELNIQKNHKILDVKPLFERIDNDKLEAIKQTLSQPYEIAEHFKK